VTLTETPFPTVTGDLPIRDMFYSTDSFLSNAFGVRR
jgi:hypothetical protein